MLAFGSSSVITVVAAVAWLVGLCVGETTELRGGKRIEFTADLERGDNWGVQFQLVDGTVAFRLTGPDGEIYNGQSENYGSYALTAKTGGIHSFEFSNLDSPGTPPKKITFGIIGQTSEVETKLDPVQKELKLLNEALRTVRDEHAFLMEREDKHRQVAMNTNKRVMWWFLMQMIMLGAVCYWQIRSLKSFFETRRLV